MRRKFMLVATLSLAACQAPIEHDVILRGGSVIDGSGSPAVVADVAIDNDKVAAVGDLGDRGGRREIDVSGLVVAPGFINMLSWANESLIQDGRSLSDIHQGVTLEVMGEGRSMGPWNEAMKQEATQRQNDIKFDVAWTTHVHLPRQLDRFELHHAGVGQGRRPRGLRRPPAGSANPCAPRVRDRHDSAGRHPAGQLPQPGAASPDGQISGRGGSDAGILA